MINVPLHRHITVLNTQSSFVYDTMMVGCWNEWVRLKCSRVKSYSQTSEGKEG